MHVMYLPPFNTNLRPQPTYFLEPRPFQVVGLQNDVNKEFGYKLCWDRHNNNKRRSNINMSQKTLSLHSALGIPRRTLACRDHLSDEPFDDDRIEELI